MSWQTVQRKGKQGVGNMDFAAEVLKTLFANSGHRSRPQQAVWKCGECGYGGNFMARLVCRQCKTKWSATPVKKGPSAPAKAASVAPWAVGEQASRKVATLEAALTVLEEGGECDDVHKVISSKLEKEKKVSTAMPSVHTQLVSVQGFIGRQENRIEKIEAEIAEMEKSKTVMVEELAASKVKMKELEEQARSQLGGPSAPSPTEKIGDLENAVRMLMVAMHACRQNLPPQLAQAVTAVSNCLPTPTGTSEDAYEEKEGMVTDDGGGFKEEDIPAGQLDVALPAARGVGTVAVWTGQLSGKREELDQCTSDEDFIAWAKAAKKQRQGF